MQCIAIFLRTISASRVTLWTLGVPSGFGFCCLEKKSWEKIKYLHLLLLFWSDGFGLPGFAILVFWARFDQNSC